MISLGCQNTQDLDGYYSHCDNGYYSEVYFKKDSMRVAADNDWVKLSEWRKIKIVNDTLFFETFGEWRDSTKAKIKYMGRDKIQLSFPETIKDTAYKLIQNLERIECDFNFNSSKEFWAQFKKRENSADF